MKAKSLKQTSNSIGVAIAYTLYCFSLSLWAEVILGLLLLPFLIYVVIHDPYLNQHFFGWLGHGFINGFVSGFGQVSH